MVEPVLIAFSGGCYSGKTTAIETARDKLSKQGMNVLVLNEILREATKMPISEIRKNANLYFELEKNIITAKILQEEKAKLHNTSEKTVVLIDRALTDSLFYYENCVNRSELTNEAIENYYAFHSYLIEKVEEHFSQLYDFVLQFKPFAKTKIGVEDKYRPVDLKYSSKFEYENIKRLNYYFSNVLRENNVYSCRVIEVDAQQPKSSLSTALDDLCETVKNFMIWKSK